MAASPSTNESDSRNTDAGGDDDYLSDDASSASFDEDMEALRRACLLTGTSSASVPPRSVPSPPQRDSESESESDDLELVQRLRQRFSSYDSDSLANPLSLKRLPALPPITSDGEEDDFETLRAIQNRFVAYDHNKEVSTAVSTKNLDSCREMSMTVDAHHAAHIRDDNTENQASACTEWHFPAYKSVPIKYSSFPKAGRLFIDAIKKNRSCQKLLRSKLIEIEARIEEIKKLKERVKILKDFQVSCRKRIGRALSQKKDARVQLITARRTPKESKVNEKRIPAMYYGPVENSHVVNYRLALTKYPLIVQRNSWSEKEKESLGKGIKQQFQEMLLQISLERFSTSDGDFSFEDILESIKDLEISPENFREFLPKVKWDQLASIYLGGRTGAECEARWLNWEDPLINHKRWTAEEDKHLLNVIQIKGINNWFDIAVSLGTYRTPFQCLARYQRSLNVCIMKREWTPDEDAMLRVAVETYGCRDWQAVASALEGRTGTQCSNRWYKTLHPDRQRVGRWNGDEDKRLRVAVMLFGPTNWRKIADHVPGRTHVQCRERWVNSLDPSLNWNAWTAEEDAKLEAAIIEHGYCWSRIAACVPPRTDNQCRRRWKALFPNEVPLLRAARKVQKAAFISNFVDRETERPAVGPGDFLPLPMITFLSESDQQPVKTTKKAKQKSSIPKKVLDRTTIDDHCRSRPSSGNYGSDVDTLAENVSLTKKRRNSRRHPRKSRGELNLSPPQHCMSNSTVKNRKTSCKRRKIPIQRARAHVRVDSEHGSEITSCSEEELVADQVTVPENPSAFPSGEGSLFSVVGDPSLLLLANSVVEESDVPSVREDEHDVTSRTREDTGHESCRKEHALEESCCNDDETSTALVKKKSMLRACSQKAGQGVCSSEDQSLSEPNVASVLIAIGEGNQKQDSPCMVSTEKNVSFRQNNVAEKIPRDSESLERFCMDSSGLTKKSRNLSKQQVRRRGSSREPRQRQLNKPLPVYTMKSKTGASALEEVPESNMFDVPLSTFLRKRPRKIANHCDIVDEEQEMLSQVEPTNHVDEVHTRSDAPNRNDLEARTVPHQESFDSKKDIASGDCFEDMDVPLTSFLHKRLRKRQTEPQLPQNR